MARLRCAGYLRSCYPAVVPEYRRAFAAGGTFFFTVVTEHRRRVFADPHARVLLRQATRLCRSRWPFVVDAAVLLPEHLHIIWTLPDGDADFSRRWGYLKKEFTRMWLAAGGTQEPRSPSRERQRRSGVLQRRFWEHLIRDEIDLRRHVEYIHYNPVKHGLVKCPHAWPFSSFTQWVRRGIYEADWACQCGSRTHGPKHFDDLNETAME